jgi:quercetin dioxygenase-like cupin family protein
MHVRADLAEAALVMPENWEWVDSPQAGVRRVMLDRVGDEVAVATSLVRYAPDSRFPDHDHARGEEFIVLEGEFADEHGRYPPGTYVRNPPGTHHAPFSDPGCLIWVKLRQFHPDDLTQMVAHLDAEIPGEGQRARVLHEYADEKVAEITAAGAEVVQLPAAERAQEVLVVEGRVRCGEHTLQPMSWLRVPAGESASLAIEAPSRLLWKLRPITNWDE